VGPDLVPSIMDHFDRRSTPSSRPPRELWWIRRLVEVAAAGLLVAGAVWLQDSADPVPGSVEYRATALDLETEILSARLDLLAARVDSFATRVESEDRASREALELRAGPVDPWERFGSLADNLPSALPLISAALLEVESADLARSRYRDLIHRSPGEPIAEVAAARLAGLGP